MNINFKRNEFPASRFGIILGLFGLGNIWKLSDYFSGSRFISEIIMFFVLLLWFVFMILYILKWFLNYEHAIKELRHPIKNNYIGLPGVTMMLMAIVMMSYNQTIGECLFLLGMVIQLLYGVYFTEQIWKNNTQFNFITPALYLPTVAGNFVSALVAGIYGYYTLGYFFLGIGFFSWLSLESIIMNRLKKEDLPLEFKPTLGIMMAPPAIACAAYFSLNLGKTNLLIIFLLGYALFQFLISLKIFFSILKNKFNLSYWSFSFGLTTLSSITIQFAENLDNIYSRYTALIVFLITNIIICYLILRSILFVKKEKLILMELQ
ncbi:hypothetical protein [uncultured Flavobacterium sp.]|uniref:SLAC1 family transporter n=1 Tax=uncultured Flavobacterium sp. TaxID=165435 RepID=UPI0030CA2DE3